jgi:hypothetical protein
VRADRGWSDGLAVLVDPQGTLTRALASPRPWLLLAVVALAWLLLGLGTVPRQLVLMNAALAPVGVDEPARHLRSLAAGLTRLMIVDRLVPLPAVLMAAVLLRLTAEPVLMLASNRRRELLVVIVLGLAPLVLLRAGELAVAWFTDVGSGIPPGEVLRLPHRFASGARLLWREGGPPPAVLEMLEARVNLFSAWSVALWAYGLSRLDTGGLRVWHTLLPVACLVGGGLVSWITGPLVLAGVLAIGG